MFKIKTEISLHKSPFNNLTNWFAATYGALLFSLSISSFWMYKPETRLFQRGVKLAIVGIIISMALLAF